MQQYFTFISITNTFQENDSRFYFEVKKNVSQTYTKAIYSVYLDFIFNIVISAAAASRNILQ